MANQQMLFSYSANVVHAVAGSNLDSGYNITQSGTTTTTNSITWTNGQLYIVFVCDTAGSANSSSLTSIAGITWTKLLNYQCNPNSGMYGTVFYGVASSSTTGGLVITDSAANGFRVSWTIDTFTGAASSGTVVQSNSATGNTNTNPFGTTLSAFGSANNGTWSVGVHSGASALTVKSGWTSLASLATGSSPTNSSIRTSWIVSNDTSPNYGMPGGSFGQSIVALEIKAA